MTSANTCPRCGKEALYPVSGTFETGVVAPDGYRETVYEEGYQCERCGLIVDEDDLPDEPLYVPCSYPDCDKLTTRDPIYDDLCARHIRADNE